MATKRAYFWGHVQGVGFRATTRHVAKHYVVTGYVRNLPDGQVEVMVSGEPAEIDRFFQAVAERMASFIHGHRIDDEPEQSFTGFEIRT